MNTIETPSIQTPNFTDHPQVHHALPKWAALLDDTLYPMPRQRMPARDILDQAGMGLDVSLVRDYESFFDEILADDAEVDLAKGNVFVTRPKCEATRPEEVEGERAKLAFVVDDRWEVTVTPNQTGRTVQHLFQVPAGVELLRDYASPHDQPIGDTEAVHFGDGPVFRTQKVLITVKVNNNPVEFAKREVSGLEIKQTAIAQKVAIKIDFALYALKPDGGLGPVIVDDEKVTLHEGDKFRALTTDDNS